MSSSIRTKTMEQIRAAKRRKQEVINAVEKGNEPRSDKGKPVEVKVRGVSAQASGGYSPKPITIAKKAESKQKTRHQEKADKKE